MSAVPMIDSYGQIIIILNDLVDYGEYADLSVALESNPAWALVEGPKVTAVGQSVLTPNVGPLVEYTQAAVELDGGVGAYSTVIDVTEASGSAVAAEATGIFAGWTIGTAVVGALAGAGIGVAMYDLAPEFWTDVSNAIFPGEDIDYDSIKDYSIIGLIKESIFGGESEATSYLTEDIVNKILDVANQHNLFTFGKRATIENKSVLKYPSVMSLPIPFTFDLIGSLGTGETYTVTPDGSSPVANIRINMNVSGSIGHQLYFASREHFSVNQGGVVRQPGQYTTHGKTYWCLEYGVRWNSSASAPSYNYTYPGSAWQSDIAYVIFEGDITNIGTPGVYELPDNPQVYNPNQTLGQQYPDWANRGVNTNAIQLPYDDPSLYPLRWIPVQMPGTDPLQHPEKYPTPGTEPMPEPIPYPATAPQPDAQRGRVPDYIPDPYKFPTQDAPRTDPRTGDDKPPNTDPPIDPTPTPPIVFPTVGGEANALFTVYNPVIGELNSLAGVLWSNNFLENLIKIFTNNPMDAIISLHMLYATPHTGGRKNIVLGCYDTHVESTVVDKQYLQIDCGTVRIPEYFGDVRDYVNTIVDVYLPFVGMRHLKTQDIIGSYVTIKAGIDVCTGTVLYTINIRKTSGINQVMYAFEGNCAVQLPLTGADKSRMFSVLGAGAMGASIGSAGGPTGMAVGAAVGMFNNVMSGSQQADVQRTGNFGANAGAMGVKIPYIVVSRNIGYDANNYSYFHGYPANKTVRIGSCTGYTRVLDCRVDGISRATDTEKSMILDALRRGVIV